MKSADRKTYLWSIAGSLGLVWVFAAVQFLFVYQDFLPRMLVVPTVVGALVGALLGRLLVLRRRLFETKQSLEQRIGQRTAQLRFEKGRLDRLIQAMPDAVVLKDTDGRWQVINHSAEQLFELADVAWNGMTDQQLAALRPRFDELFNLPSSGETQADGSDLLVLKIDAQSQPSRPEQYLEIRRLPLPHAAEQPEGRMMVVRDITREKRAIDEARHHLQNQALLLKAVGEGVYGIDPEGRCTFANDAAISLLGYNREEVLGADLHALFHHHRPDGSDYPPEECPIHQTLRDGQTRHAEEWFIHKAGHFFPVEITITPVHTADSGAVVVFRDMSERRRIEEDLRIAGVAFEHMQPVIIADRDQRILRVNEAFEQMTGYTAEEAIGQTPRLLQSGHHDKNFYRAMWDQINRVGQWQGEVMNRRKDGGIYAEWLNISVVRDEAGEITHYVASVHDLSEQKKAQEEIEKLAFYDPLTGLPNRRLLKDRLRQAIAVSQREQNYGALLFIDLDNFKTLNDTRGHAIGDLLLESVARRLTESMRESDTVARIGGDEFVILLSQLGRQVDQAEETAAQVAEKILAQISRPHELAGQKHAMTPSVGVSLFLGNRMDADQLLKQADIAMYQAKDAGRNAIRFFDPETQTRLERHVEMESRLRHALENGELTMHLQPIVDQSGHVRAAEVLARWPQPDGQWISPGEFIPLAEQTGLIVPLGNWITESACRLLAGWQDRPELSSLTLSVNLSARQLMQGSCTGQMTGLLERTGAPAQLLKLEITETTMMSNQLDVIEIFKDLCALGVRLSLDDFGTGYSSLSYLKRLPLNQLKIDQSFVRDITTDGNDAAIVETIIAMARALDLGVVAEGVETEEQFAFLRAHDCDLYQGFLFHRPMPVEAFEQLMRPDADRPDTT
ncbi:MAG: EAL domain-containing protein [Halothiobacillaceae bacterium]